MFDSSTRRFRVLLDSPDLTFNASHFLSFPTKDAQAPWFVEPLHGHDFRASFGVEGALDASRCVVDFIVARTCAFDVLRSLNHRVILASRESNVEYSERNGEMEIRDKGSSRRWVLPLDYVAQLDATNASTEEIAARILDEWIDALIRSKALDSRNGRKFFLRLQETPGAFVDVERCFEN